MAKITINGITINPATEGVALANANLLSADSADSNYILIQTSGPLTRAQREELAEFDVQIIEYVPTNTYLCRYAPTDLDVLRALPFVEWVNVYMHGFKIAPQLHSPSVAAETANLLALGEPETSMSQTPRKINVVLHQGVNAEDVRGKIARAARLDPQTLQITPSGVSLTVSPQHLADLAAIDEVRHLEEFTEAKLSNSIAIRLMRADAVHNQVDLQGAGQIVAICDTGFDLGLTTDTHPAFNGRVRKLYALGRPASANDPDGHGTHVAGSVLGDGASATMGGAVRGAAPKAELVLQSVLDSNGELGGLPDSLHDLFLPPYRDDGARVHTNSWGASRPFTFGRYNVWSKEVDEFVWEHRDCVICFSAGNEGTDSDANGVINSGSITPPATAKNCITVGASESRRPDISKRYGDEWPQDYPVAPLATDGWADNPQGIAAFSSPGPTRNERIKPDVVAPGTAILSSHSRAAHVGPFWGASSDPLFCFMGGTSMATPLVAGCAAVVREHIIKNHNHTPSAALVKALLINGASDLLGQYIPSEIGVIPNIAEGFGRVNLQATVGPFPDGVTLSFKDEAVALDTNERN